MNILQDILGLIIKGKVKSPTDKDYMVVASYTDAQEILKPQPKMQANLVNIGALKKFIQTGGGGGSQNLQQVTDQGNTTTKDVLFYNTINEIGVEIRPNPDDFAVIKVWSTDGGPGNNSYLQLKGDGTISGGYASTFISTLSFPSNITQNYSLTLPVGDGYLATSVNGVAADINGNITVSGISTPSLQEVTDIGAITIDPIKVTNVKIGDYDGISNVFSISNDDDEINNLYYNPFTGFVVTDGENNTYMNGSSIGTVGSIRASYVFQEGFQIAQFTPTNIQTSFGIDKLITINGEYLYPTGLTSPLATLADITGGLPTYKAYIALLEQSNVFNPTAEVLGSTLVGGSINWQRIAVGVYRGTSLGSFNVAKTVIFNNITNGDIQIASGVIDANTIQLIVRTMAGVTTDDGINRMSLEIRVYD